MPFKINNCAIVILAAGTSSRLGKPKQLLDFEGDTLIKRIANIALETQINPVIVVLGANYELINPQLEGLNLEIIVNSNWQEGISSSIKIGLNTILEKHPEVDGLIILLADQPYILAKNIKQLIVKQKVTGRPILASRYNNILGTPALFHKSLFSQLGVLTGDVGARKIIEQNKDNLAFVNFEKGIIDIDTEQDYQKLLNKNHVKR